MPDIDLAVSINRSPRMSFVAGEDRVFALSLKDLNEDLPLDLSGGQLTFAFPRAGGGSIKRRTNALVADWSTSVIQNGMTVIASASHGLVSGDAVMLAPLPPVAALPAPYDPTATYLVVYVDADSFGLIDMKGLNVALKLPSTDAVAVNVADFVVNAPSYGQATLALGGHVTDMAATGQGLTFQLTYTSPSGSRRFFSGTNQLDVFAQPCP